MDNYKWEQTDSYLGYYDADGKLEIVEEYGISDRDCGNYIEDVLNGNGYYNDYGDFVRFDRNL